MTFFTAVDSLIRYGTQKKLIEREDETFVRNSLLSVFGEDSSLKTREHGIARVARPSQSRKRYCAQRRPNHISCVHHFSLF